MPHNPVASMLATILHATMSQSLLFREGHWNVKGPHFDSYHSLYGDLYSFLDDTADLIAERIVQLDGYATPLATYSPGRSSSSEDAWLTSLLAGMQHLSEMVQNVISRLPETDEATRDILVESNRALEKWIWKLKAHDSDVQA